MNKQFCLFLVLLGVAVLLSGCGGVNKKTIKRAQIMEEGIDSPSTIQELQDAIKKYERRIEDLISSQEQTGIWYKILASRYLDNQMYAEALEALQNAIYYYPANQNLYYWVGISAGYMANAALDFSASGNTAERDKYLLLAESGYKRAIELEPEYSRALYGLGVLYTFEMEEPAKAISILELLLKIDTKNIDGMFVLARAYYMTYDFERSTVLYDTIISLTTVKEKKEEAEANKKVVLDAMYQ